MRFLPLLVLMFLPAVAALAGPPETWPTKGWPVSTPEAQGLDGALLGSFDRDLAAGQHGYVDGMLVIRHGSLVFEKSYAHDYQGLFVGKGAPGLYNYYDPAWHPYWKSGELHTMQSVSKSVTSALVGIAMRRGEIPGVDAKVMPYFSAFKTKPDPRRDAMTLRDVLTMTTGIQWDESSSSYTNAKNNCAEMEATDGLDPVRPGPAHGRSSPASSSSTTAAPRSFSPTSSRRPRARKPTTTRRSTSWVPWASSTPGSARRWAWPTPRADSTCGPATSRSSASST